MPPISNPSTEPWPLSSRPVKLLPSPPQQRLVELHAVTAKKTLGQWLKEAIQEKIKREQKG